MLKYDDDLIKEIDKGMGWIKEDGSSPSKTASDLGMRCKFMDGPFSSTAWKNPDGLWSVCVLSGIKTTLLAKSFNALEKLYRKLRERQKESKIGSLTHWQNYYRLLWERRYTKWRCKKPFPCKCQLCRSKENN